MVTRVALACIHRPVCAGRHMARALRRIGVDLRTVGWSTGQDTGWGTEASDTWQPDGPFEKHWPDWTPDLVLYMDTEFNPWHYAAYGDVPHVNYCTTVKDMTMPGMAHYFVAQRNSKAWPFRPADMTWLPNAYDPVVCQPSPIPWEYRAFDVCLVGRLDKERTRILDAMEKAGLRVKRARGLIGREYALAYQNSRISLCTGGPSQGTTMRLFETAALGCLVLSGPIADEEHLDFWGYTILPDLDPDLFVDLARWYLDRPHEALDMISQSLAWVKPHTWDARAEAIVAWLDRRREKEPYTVTFNAPHHFEGSLNDTLTDLARWLNLPAQELTDYAKEDTFTGWDYGAGDFPVGSIFREEGQVLYALIRALWPSSVIELGTAAGASATHIAAALAANSTGKLTAVDHGLHPGALIPDALQGTVKVLAGDALEYLERRRRVDIIFEDLDHQPETVAAVARLAADKLTPGGLLISHDAMHPTVGPGVRQGYADAGLEGVHFYGIDPGDCGLAVWRKPLE